MARKLCPKKSRGSSTRGDQIMYICELSFENSGRDPENPGIYFMEVDYYASIPFDFVQPNIPQHALSLRKNWRTKWYEVYRRFRRDGDVQQVIIFSDKNLEKTIRWASYEWRKYWGHREIDTICEHQLGIASFSCPNLKRK